MNDNLCRDCAAENRTRKSCLRSREEKTLHERLSLQAVNATRQKLITGLRFLETKLSECSSEAGQKPAMEKNSSREGSLKVNSKMQKHYRQLVSRNIFHALCMNDKGIFHALSSCRPCNVCL